MPKILIYKNLIFFFYAGDINERGHIHIIVNKNYSNAAKIWFEGKIEIFEKGSLNKKQLSDCIKIIDSNLEYIIESWNLFKKNKKNVIRRITKI